MTNAQGIRGWAAAMLAAILMMLAATAAPAQNSVTFTTLHAFERSDGLEPEAGLLQATDDNFYGTTFSGTGFRDGTIFKMTPTGTVTTFYTFCSLSVCPDGKFPMPASSRVATGTSMGRPAAGDSTASARSSESLRVAC